MKRRMSFGLVLALVMLPGLVSAFQAVDGGRGLYRVQDARSEGWGWLTIQGSALYRYTMWPFPVTNDSTDKRHKFDAPAAVSYAFTDWLEIMATSGYAAASQEYSHFNLNHMDGSMMDLKAGGKLCLTSWLPVFKLGGAYSHQFAMRKYDSLPANGDNRGRGRGKSFGEYPLRLHAYDEARGLLSLAFGEALTNIPITLTANYGCIWGGSYDDIEVTPTAWADRTRWTTVGLGAEMATRYIQIFAEGTTEAKPGYGLLSDSAVKDLTFGGRIRVGPVGIGVQFINQRSGKPALAGTKITTPTWIYSGGIYFSSPVGRPPMGNLVGTVIDARTGAPLAGSVGLPQVKAYKNKKLVVDNHGAFRVNNVPVGSILVEAEVPEYYRYSGYALVENGKTAMVEIKLRPLRQMGTITGRVTDAKTGDPLTARVTFPGSPLEELTTDAATGVYTVRDVLVGTLAINVEVEGYRMSSASVAIKDNEVTTQNFEMNPTNVYGSITGRVVNANTRSPLAATLTFTDGAVEPAATDPATGVFNVTQSPVGTVTIEASAEGYAREARPLVVEESKVTNVEFLLRPLTETGIVSGSVTEVGTGRPLTGEVTFSDPTVAATPTDPSTGFYKVDNVPVGVMVVKATAEGYNPAQATVTVEAAKPTAQNFTLSPSTTNGELTGIVTDMKTKGALKAAVYFPGTSYPLVLSDEATGMYRASVPIGAVVVACSCPGYVKQMSTSPIIIKQGEPAVYNFQLLKIGTEITLRADKIHFDFNKSDIQPAGYPVLNEWVKLMNENPDMTAEIQGHTDAVGSESYNQALSERRAASVVNYLASQGISRARLTSYGYGESRLVVETQEKSEENRRVVLKVTGELKR